jgi:predicted RNA binding protein YcfA (HicA-like mRNA interferase family)
MGKYPVLKPREVISTLEKLGFEEIRQKGSHKQFHHPDCRHTTLPIHGNRDISPIILKQVAKDIGMSIDEMLSAR